MKYFYLFAAAFCTFVTLIALGGGVGAAVCGTLAIINLAMFLD